MHVATLIGPKGCGEARGKARMMRYRGYTHLFAKSNAPHRFLPGYRRRKAQLASKAASSLIRHERMPAANTIGFIAIHGGER